MLTPVCTVSAMHLNFTVQRIRPSSDTLSAARAALREERAVFINSFLTSYSGYPAGTIKLPPATTLSNFLADAFASDEHAFTHASTFAHGADAPHRFYNATMLENGMERTGGYLSVDVLDGGRVSYLRQLAVLPEFQKAGIARALVQCCIDDLPKLQKLTVSYRKTNTAAAGFYRKFGFVDDDMCHETLDSELYDGLVWYK